MQEKLHVGVQPVSYVCVELRAGAWKAINRSYCPMLSLNAIHRMAPDRITSHHIAYPPLEYLVYPSHAHRNFLSTNSRVGTPVAALQIRFASPHLARLSWPVPDAEKPCSPDILNRRIAAKLQWAFGMRIKALVDPSCGRIPVAGAHPRLIETYQDPLAGAFTHRKGMLFPIAK